ncbi:hypothetical protein CSIV_12455 [Microbacterium sp. CSI-V]|uniref:hypothetical protein n=1 Tax=unclassified Microbacterium TaxID=2609290 RepID=UPI00097BBD27|nr:MULTISPECIES: hypothetical protein [unclassified Microbacterium]MXS73687.1 hypothetical protein [Microbacterium sp. TL13]ONI62321.1 hypothetical protein CSIV_12455 [Microbacterium sp. CSI-V]
MFVPLTIIAASVSSEPASVTVDPLALYVLPLALALLGVVGVAIGAWISARSALRSRLIDMNAKEAEAEREFGVRAVAAVTDLGIATHHLIEDLQTRGAELARGAKGQPVSVLLTLDPARMARVTELTDTWRAVLAESQFYTAGALADALRDFDTQRDVVVRMVNAAGTPQDLEEAMKECDAFRDFYARQVYLRLQVEKMRGRARIYHLAHVRRLRHLARSLTDDLQREMITGEKLARIAQAERVLRTSKPG